jgi:glyoxylase-like metal-dependent hydrolase (beta-lactamase superfamily II)
MRTRRATRHLATVAFVLVICCILMACGSGEVELMQTSSENKVHPVKHSGANIYLIETDRGHILVDVGMPGSDEALDAAFEAAGAEPGTIQLIVLTHGHVDHVGAVAYAKQVTGASVLAHRSLAASLENNEIEKAVIRTGNLMTRVMTALSDLIPFTGVKPDIVMDDELDLAEYGIAGKVIHTPGHSASSVSIVLDDGEALIGDMVREEDSGEIGLGSFYEDKGLLLDSLEKVAALEPRIIYLSHGSTINDSTLQSAIEANR